MDEAESKAGETVRETVADKSTVQSDAAELRAEAEQELRRMKSIGFRGLFSFDTLLFPKIARVLFFIYCVLLAIGLAVGVLAGLAAMIGQGLFAGLAIIVAAVISCVIMFVATRVWFEIVLVMFKLYESVDEIRRQLQNKVD